MTKHYVLIDDSDTDTTAVELEAGPVYVSGASPAVPLSQMGISFTPMPHLCTWNEATGSGSWGVTYTAHLLVPCRFSQATSVVKKPNNVEVISNAAIRCVAAVKSIDQIVYGAVTYPVLSVRTITDINGDTVEFEVRL